MKELNSSKVVYSSIGFHVQALKPNPNPNPDPHSSTTPSQSLLSSSSLSGRSKFRSQSFYHIGDTGYSPTLYMPKHAHRPLDDHPELTRSDYFDGQGNCVAVELKLERMVGRGMFWWVVLPVMILLGWEKVTELVGTQRHPSSYYYLSADVFICPFW